MTRRVDNLVIIEQELPQQCDQCGRIEEVRPYGPNGQVICWDCGQQDPTGTEQRMIRALYSTP